MAVMTYEDRSRQMVAEYGETCSKAVAARIMGCDSRTINRWIADGRIDSACAGTRVDVRSLARYITAPGEEDFQARKRIYALRTGSKFYV